MAQLSECGILIKQINDSIARLANNELRQNNLTLSQLRYLEYIYAHEGTPVLFKEVERHFKVSQPTAAGILRRLESKKLIKTNQSENGGKSKTVCLTDSGKALYESAEARRIKTEINLLSPLKEDERITFQEMLAKVLEHLKET